MKVLHIITCLEDGGAEAVLYRLIQATPHIEHKVMSLKAGGKYGGLLKRLGVAVVSLEMPSGRVTWLGVRELWKVIRKESPDVIQTWMYHADLLGGVVARGVGCKKVVWGIHNSTLNRGATYLVAKVCGFLSRWIPSRIIVCGKKAAYENCKLGYRREKMVIIHNGYDVTEYKPDFEARMRLRNELGIVGDQPLIGCVARWHPDKDHENLISALSSLKDLEEISWKVVLVGPGMNKQNADLVSLVECFGIEERVILLGPRSDIPSVMNAIDLHVLSSSTEAFPNVLCEAMACGTPCVTTDVGDAALIVGETGWVVPPGNASKLSESMGDALRDYAENADQWQARKEAARERIVKSFSLEIMALRYQEVWNEVYANAAST